MKILFAGMGQAKVLYDREDHVPSNPATNAEFDLALQDTFYHPQAQGRKKRRRGVVNDNCELPNRVVPIIICPCVKCSSPKRDTPIPRSLTTVQEHLKKNDMCDRWKVR